MRPRAGAHRRGAEVLALAPFALLSLPFRDPRPTRTRS